MRCNAFLIALAYSFFSFRGRWETSVTDNSFPNDDIRQFLTDYQDPAQADKITKIQRDLDATTDILVSDFASSHTYGLRTSAIFSHSSLTFHVHKLTRLLLHSYL